MAGPPLTGVHQWCGGPVVRWWGGELRVSPFGDGGVPPIPPFGNGRLCSRHPPSLHRQYDCPPPPHHLTTPPPHHPTTSPPILLPRRPAATRRQRRLARMMWNCVFVSATCLPERSTSMTRLGNCCSATRVLP